MFKLLSSSLKLFVTAVLLSLKRGSFVVANVTNLTYSHRYYLADQSLITVDVKQFEYTVHYDQWWIPDLVRFIYTASLKKYVNNTLVDSWNENYPELNRSKIYDPLYPLVNIATFHVERYVERTS